MQSTYKIGNTGFVLSSEVCILNSTQTERNFAVLMKYGDDDLALFK